MTSDDLQPTSAGTPLWFLIAMMSLVTGTAFVFLFLGRWTAPGANLPEDELKILSLAYEYIDRDYIYEVEGINVSYAESEDPPLEPDQRSLRIAVKLSSTSACT